MLYPHTDMLNTPAWVRGMCAYAAGLFTLGSNQRHNPCSTPHLSTATRQPAMQRTHLASRPRQPPVELVPAGAPAHSCTSLDCQHARPGNTVMFQRVPTNRYSWGSAIAGRQGDYMRSWNAAAPLAPSCTERGPQQHTTGTCMGACTAAAPQAPKSLRLLRYRISLGPHRTYSAP